MSSRKLSELLNPSDYGELANMVGQAQAVASLSGRLREALPAELADALVMANVGDDGRLVVIARSPAWAARLRFEADRLMAAAGTAGRPATQCVVRVSHDAPAEADEKQG